MLFVTLLKETDPFILGLSIQLAGLQTRKPDEVVLLVSESSLLNGPTAVPKRDLVDAQVELEGQLGSNNIKVRKRNGELLDIHFAEFLTNLRDRMGTVAVMNSGYGPPRTFVLSVASCPDELCSVKPALAKSFEREFEPETVLMYVSAERLVNERLIQENIICINACGPHCTKDSWCGQTSLSSDGAIYDLTIKRVAGYRDYIAN